MGAPLQRSFSSAPAWLLRVLRLGRRPRPLWEPPWAGAYRTRPALEPEPARRVPRPTSPRRQALGHGLMSAAFVAGGLLLARHPHQSDDRLCGLTAAIFFGLCSWVFVEQMIQDAQVLSRSAGHRLIAALGLAGGGLVHVAVAEAAAPIVYRAGVTLVGVFLAGVAAWAGWRVLRARP